MEASKERDPTAIVPRPAGDQVALIRQAPWALPPAVLRQAVQEETERRTVLVDYFQKNMQAGRHYYWLRGEEDRKAGKKPSLSKEGALNLAGLFFCRVDPEPPQITRHGDGHLTVLQRVHLVAFETGQRLATGDALCTTREFKYAFRWAWPEQVPAALEKDRLRMKAYRSGKVQYAVPNEELADQENTVVKMAFKRAAVAAALVLPVVSELFTQDLEELIPDNGGDGAGGAEDEGAGSPEELAAARQAVMDAARKAGKTEQIVRALARGKFRREFEEITAAELGELVADLDKQADRGPAKPVGPEPTGTPPPKAPTAPAAETAARLPGEDEDQRKAREMTMVRIYKAMEAISMTSEEMRGYARTVYAREPEAMPVDMLALLAGRLEKLVDAKATELPKA